MSKYSERIKVSVRCRPMSQKEKNEGYQNCVEVDNDRGEVNVHLANTPKRTFWYDKAYGMDSTQEQVFQETAMPIVESVVQGYNGTIFAYGQTGTGKTFTMEGDFETDINKGIIPRSFDLMFNIIKTTYNTNFLIQCSYLELYNEEVRDLLAKNHQQKLDIREDPETGFYVQDLSHWVVKAPKDMIELMLRGRELKVIKGHNMNERSSRSHCIFTIIVENSTSDETGEHIKKGKLNLVDLAGSERTSKIKDVNGAEGLQAETIHINLSLTALGKVIHALASNKKQHIPYRDSKLTKLLMDSLGGNSKTVMIANIGPADYNIEETLTTLRYADRAKNIKNIPKVNEDPKDAMIKKYKEELERLREALAKANGGIEVSINQFVSNDAINNDSINRIAEIQNQLIIEKKKIKEDEEKKIKELQANTKITEDEKMDLMNQLKLKQEEQNKKVEAKKKIMDKLQKLEEKFLLGEKTKEQAKKNEQILNEEREELKAKEKRQKELQDKIKKDEEMARELEANFKNQDDEIEKKTKLFNRLKEDLKKVEMEGEEIKKEYEISQNIFHNEMEKLNKKINYSEEIIKNIIPKKYLKMIFQMMSYNEERDEYFLPGIDDMPEIKKEEKNNGLVMSYYDVNDEDYETTEDEVQLKDIIEMGNQQKSVYLTYDQLKKIKNKN
jgi:kinesin family protein 3/17